MAKLLLWFEYGVISVILVFWFYEKFKNYFRSVYIAFNMRGPKPFPVFGNIFLITDHKKLNYMANNATDLYGSMFRTWILHVPLFCVYEPDHLKVLLSGSKVHSDKNFFYSLAETFIGKGLITNNGYAWKKNRKALQPYFNINILENYLGIFSECAQYVVKNLRQDKYTNIVELINMTVLKSLHSIQLIQRQSCSIYEAGYSIFFSGQLLAIKRVVQPWLMADFMFKYSNMSKTENKQRHSLKEYVKQAIENRRKAKTNGKIKFENACLLDLMLEIYENHEDFTEEDIVNEAITFVLAGQDSVGAALALNLFYLARSPEIQEKAYQEINEVITDENDLNCIKLEQLYKMQYLKRCIKESLRLAPGVPVIFRILKEETQLGEYTMPAGTNLCILPFFTHRLPHIFPDPLKFDPDRFLPENISKRHPYAYVPFSSGPRNCIGSKFATLEMQTIIATVLKHYKLCLKPGTEEVTFSYRIALRAKGGIWIKATSRSEKCSDIET